MMYARLSGVSAVAGARLGWPAMDGQSVSRQSAGTLSAGSAALHTRWHPAMLAATHAFTLGVFGNLLFGSLLQFLPAAVGTSVRGGRRAALLLHALLNLGTFLLVLALYGALRVLFVPASVLLSAAFILFAAMTVPGLLAAHGQRLLRGGLGIGYAAAFATAALANRPRPARRRSPREARRARR